MCERISWFSPSILCSPISMLLAMDTSSTERFSLSAVLAMSACSILSTYKITSVSSIVSFLYASLS